MVKAQKFITINAARLGAILSIALLGAAAAAGKTPPPATTPPPVQIELGSGWAEEIVADTAKNETDRKRLEAVPPESPLARQIRRDIARRGEKAETYAERAPTNVPVLTAAADQALGNGDVARAQSRAEQAVAAAAAETDPRKFAEKWPLAMNTRAQIAKAMDDYPAANAYALKVLEKFPKDPNALALYHDTKGRAKAGTAPAPLAARSPLKTAPPAPPPAMPPAAPGAQTHLDRAATFIGMRDFQGALDSARRASALEPANPDAHMQQAVAWSALKNLSEAMLAISRAIERLAEGDPRLPAAYNTRALYKNRTGDYVGAAADASAAITRDPVFADAYYQRSEAQKALGKRPEFLADIKKAAELRPADYRDLYAVAARETAEPAPATAPAAGRARMSGLRLAIGGVGALLFLVAAVVLFRKGQSTARRFFTRPPGAPAEAAPPRLLAGHIELQGELDRGGMGVVYRAFDRNLQRPVAVKRLSPELQDRESERARILAEARTLALFHHPNIMEVHDVITEGEDIFIVCPLLDGHTVHAELKGLGLEPGRAVEIARAVGAAIDYSHGKGVVHRDLKPSNIMLTKDGRILVMDYGIAKSNLNHSRVTRTDAVAGTPAYMAPEQETGQVCRQSDVFALGVTAYEMLTGRLPFSFNDLSRKLEKRPGRFAPPASLRPALPAALDAVFERALAAEPAQRQKNCAELVAELDAALRQPTPPRA